MKKILIIGISTMIVGTLMYGSMLDRQKKEIITNQISLPLSQDTVIIDSSNDIVANSAKDQEKVTSEMTNTNAKTQILRSSEKVNSPTPTSTTALNLVFEDNFEEGLSNNWLREMTKATYSGVVSTKYAREGTQSFRIELCKNDSMINNGKRSEISTVEPELAADDSTYAFSVLLPKDGSEDYALDPDGDEIIAQWHNSPDPGEEWTYPPLALHTRGNGHYVLTRCWDEDPMSSEEKMDEEGKKGSYDLGSYLDDKGKWVDWSFHVKWGWLDSQHPLIQIYKNGTKIFEIKDEPNITNDRQGVFMKLGIYKWEWGQKSLEINQSILADRVIYYDNVSIQHN